MILLFSSGENLRRRRQWLPALGARVADRRLLGIAVRTGDDQSGLTRLTVVPEERSLATGGTVDLEVEAAGRTPGPSRPDRTPAIGTAEWSGRFYLSAGGADRRIGWNQFVAVPTELAVPGHGHDLRSGSETEIVQIR